MTQARGFVLSMVPAFFIFATALSFHSVQAQTGNTFGLGSSVVIESGGTAYLSDPEGSVIAINLDSGAQLWTTPRGKAYRPLAISGNFLVAMQEGGPKEGKHLGIALLRLPDGVEQLVNWVELPSAAWTSVKNGLGSSLRTSAAGGPDGRVTISWVSEWKGMKGTATEDDETPGGVARAAAAQSEASSGSVEIDPSGRVLTPSRATLAPQQIQAARQDVPVGQRVKGLPDTQFFSADERHILVSELIGNDNELNKYRWTVYPAAGNEPIGVITAPFPAAPFYVSGTTIFYQLRPYMIRDQSDQMVRSMLKLIAVDMKSGGKLWEREVLDTEYYGPFPP